ncbi:Pentatricopeptide repeat-containing protein [Apostasia shenzhenica]|uniref:Pentatricopeptide repeat-containing protein n=1 Tax=Apostasia shenzhenica TaxID=1088818 RepID=A0A2I0AQP4_9ASPA|nr:Pentatricopeptide repeat-containing protein [Apostasia shenzhenica]
MLKPRHSPPLSPLSARAQLLSLLNQCKTIEPIKQIHSQMLVSSLHFHNHLLCKLVELKDFSYSSLLFSQIRFPNDFTFNIMIRGLSTSWQNYPLALEFYLQLLRSGEKPSKFTFPFVFISAASLPSFYHGLIAHSSVIQRGLDSDLNIRHSLITMYARCGDIKCAQEVFDEIAERDVVSWNAMISGFLRMGCSLKALELFRRMRAEGFEPNGVTATSVLSACGDVGDLSLGKEVAEMVMESGLEMSSFVLSALIDMYGKCGDLEAARQVFDEHPRRDLSVWNAMITGYSQNGLSDEAIRLFNSMREANMEPDKMTMVGVLSACGTTGALQLGQWMDDFALRRGLHQNVYVGTALIDMYAKCGHVDRAIDIFHSMPNKNIVSWNAMISGLAFNGRGREALLLFNRMKNEEVTVRPNGVTFIGVLTACVHAGFVQEGRNWWNLMKSKFGIFPKIEHYSCMVDLLARAGHLEEAWRFIENMPVKPDAVLLGALLCACRNFRNVEIGEKVVRRILLLEPSNSGNYVISSKIFVDSKRWEDSARMRGLMRARGIAKTPGCSWIEVENQVKEFHAGDGLHPISTEIHQLMEILIKEMKLEGYTPRTDLL